MKTLAACLCLLLATSLAGCETCREVAIRHAQRYRTNGSETRIAVYYCGLECRILSLGLYDAHAQAQVRRGDKWLWIGELDDIEDSPTYQITKGPYYYTIEEYRQLLRSLGLKVPKEVTDERP